MGRQTGTEGGTGLIHFYQKHEQTEKLELSESHWRLIGPLKDWKKWIYKQMELLNQVWSLK